MRKVLQLLPKLALVAALTVSLGFGASEAVACSECTQPPFTECENEPEPDQFCDELCKEEQDCPGGACDGSFGCRCFF